MEATRGAALSSAPTGNPIVPDPRNEPLARRSQHGGQPARARCSAWDIGRIGWARSRKWPRRAASRGARGGAGKGIPETAKSMIAHSHSFDGTSHSDFGLDQKERLRHYSLEVSRIL